MTRVIEILTLGSVLLSGTGTTLAQQTTSDATISDRLIRAKYSRSDEMPIEIAFLGTLRFLYGINQNRSATAVAFIKRDMDLEQIEAEEFLALLLRTYDSIMADSRNRKYDLACAGGAPKVVGAEVYATFEAMDDVSGHVAAVRLNKLRAEIGPDKTRRLERWLESQKKKIADVKYNRKELHTSRGEDAEHLVARLAELCEAWVSDHTGDRR